MKKIGIIMMFVAMLGASSCSSLSGVSDSAAATTGNACARALLALRASQKAGTLSITNATDLSNMLVVIGAYNTLKSNMQNKSFKSSFTKGLVAGGSGAITNSNASTIVNLLLAANGLSNVNSSNISTSGAKTTTAITPVLNTLL